MTTKSAATLAVVLVLLSISAWAKPRTPLPPDAFDGAMVSGETIGRGGTIASNRPTAASGSENPAALYDSHDTAAYATALVHTASDLDKSTTTALDPLESRVLRYMSVSAERGVLFYEPVSRIHQRFPTDASANPTDFADVEFAANALGFAAADKLGTGSIGISIAYLWASLADHRFTNNQLTSAQGDTAEGFRMNWGLRYPVGPAMLGLTIQNAPAFLWWKDYRRDQLPLKIRSGATWRIASGFLLSADAERRYHREGSDLKDVYYVGAESFAGKPVSIRAGAYGERLDQPENRHWTAGISLSTKWGTELTYALDVGKVADQSIKQSVVSLKIPLHPGTDE